MLGSFETLCFHGAKKRGACNARCMALTYGFGAETPSALALPSGRRTEKQSIDWRLACAVRGQRWASATISLTGAGRQLPELLRPAADAKVVRLGGHVDLGGSMPLRHQQLERLRRSTFVYHVITTWQAPQWERLH